LGALNRAEFNPQLDRIMYKIIGVDGKEYGPISPDQLRDWLRQGRVGQQTPVRPESGGDWRPLSSYPEFNFAPGVATLAPPTLSDRASKKIPAGVCGIVVGALGIHKFILGYTGAGLIMLLVSVLTCGLAAPVFGLIGLIEGILYLSKSDEDFVRTYVDGRKEWF
jgi:TM2 domain-containing membrane protein YozV